jgi:hypothetical protein
VPDPSLAIDQLVASPFRTFRSGLCVHKSTGIRFTQTRDIPSVPTEIQVMVYTLCQKHSLHSYVVLGWLQHLFAFSFADFVYTDFLASRTTPFHDRSGCMSEVVSCVAASVSLAPSGFVVCSSSPYTQHPFRFNIFDYLYVLMVSVWGSRGSAPRSGGGHGVHDILFLNSSSCYFDTVYGSFLQQSQR